jgi:hypothetical protein
MRVPKSPLPEPTMPEPSYEELKAELERVKKERDGYRETVADMLRRHFELDLDELEAELRDWQQNGGGVPFEQVLAQIEAEFGIKI